MNHHLKQESTEKDRRPAKLPRRDCCVPGNSNDSIRTMTFLEFYAGIGGWSMALEAALRKLSENNSWLSKEEMNGVSIRCLAAFDHSNLCTKVYEHNLRNDTAEQTTPANTSIEKLTLKQMEEWSADIWAMSPPCQPHTRQHSNQDADLDDPRSKSFLHLCDLIEKMDRTNLPTLVLLENVVGFQKSNSCQRFRQALSKRGYRTAHFHLSPSQVGLPNDRPRHFCVAVQLQNATDWEANVSLMKYFGVEAMECSDGEGCKIYSSLKELRVIENSDVSGETIPCISDFLDKDGNDNLQLRIPDKTLSSNTAWCFDIVTPQDRRSSCFTQSYGRYVRGTGSVLYFGSLINATDSSGSDPTRLQLVPPEEREFDKDWAKGLDLKNSMRYFSGNEIARIFDFPGSFEFPYDCTLRQQWKLLGNSLNVRVAARICELGLRLVLEKR